MIRETGRCFSHHTPEFKKKQVVINFYGAPGAGKSTHAASLFAFMKTEGANCELVTEYAKDLTWSNESTKMGNQIYLFGKQYERMRRLSEVKFIITDSPLPLMLYYGASEPDYFKKLVMCKYNEYVNINFLVKRDKEYKGIGRAQTQEESDVIHDTLVILLHDNCIQYTDIMSSTYTHSVNILGAHQLREMGYE